MNYKKIFRTRKTRQTILRTLSFVPDSLMLRIQYWIKFGRMLNLKNPQRFTEKLQWYKLYYKDPQMVQCVDKYDVRAYVKSLGLGSILNECYGVFDRPEDIDFSKLPERFVLKDTLGGGGNSVILVPNKSRMDVDAVMSRMRRWVNMNHRVRSGGREWPYYSGKKHRIIVEKFIDSESKKGGLIDYKFFCFHGKVAYIYGIADRIMGNGAGLGIYNAEFALLPYRRADEHPLLRELQKPDNFDVLIDCAQKLSQRFPHARVDFYDQDNRIIFGEITFFDGSGYMKYEPDEFDFTAGEMFDLPEKRMR